MMSCTRIYVEPTETLAGQGRKRILARNSQSCRVSFSGSCSPKLLVSITTDQLARYGLIADDNDSLGGREPENETDNFVRCSLGRATLNLENDGQSCQSRSQVSRPPKLLVFITTDQLARSGLITVYTDSLGGQET